MNNIEQSTKITCQFHPSMMSTYLLVDREMRSLTPLCSKCPKLNNFDLNNLLLVSECLSNDENNIIANWPPLEDLAVEQKFVQSLLESYFHNEKMEEEEKYFKKMKEEIISSISRIQKISLIFKNCDIFETYNKIS